MKKLEVGKDYINEYGVVANACIEADRDLTFIGSELSKEQCEYAEKRVEEKRKEKDLVEGTLFETEL